jgi:ATP-binding cassette subfamily C protein/ATP-binding cassette subfamily C protein CydD
VAKTAAGPQFRAAAGLALPWLAGAVAVGVAQALLLIGLATVLARLLAGALSGGLTARAIAADSRLFLLLAVAQGLAGWAWEICVETAARRARGAVRQRAVAQAICLAAAQGGLPGGRARAADGPGSGGTDDTGPGGVVALLGAGIDELDPFTGRVLPRAALALAVPALLLAWIAHLDLLSAGLAALALALGPVLAALIGTDTAAAVRRRVAGLERLGDRFAALVGGLAVLRAFGRAGEHERSVAASGEEVRAATLAVLRLALLTGFTLEILAAMGTALVAVPLGLRLDSGSRILPQALAILILTPAVFLPLRELAADFHAGRSGRETLARLSRLGIWNAPDQVPGHAPAGQDGAEARVGTRAGDGDGSEPPGVVLDDVSVLMAGRGRPALDHVGLWVRPGGRLCLTGESGAGKTTLLRVAAGLVTPSTGRAALTGPGAAAGGRPALAWVPQHPTVLTASVLDNVALGRSGVSASTARAALEAAQLGPWLADLPAGIHTQLSGLHPRLSLGERRRLAIARALAGPRAGLWLLDEPTAGLDPGTAASLLQVLRQVIGGATALIATHDPAVLSLGQQVAELAQGRLISVRAGPADRAQALAYTP